MRCFYVGIERHYNHGSPQFRDGDGRQAPKPRSGALKAPGFTTVPIPETIMGPLSTTGAPSAFCGMTLPGDSPTLKPHWTRQLTLLQLISGRDGIPHQGASIGLSYAAGGGLDTDWYQPRRSVYIGSYPLMAAVSGGC